MLHPLHRLFPAMLLSLSACAMPHVQAPVSDHFDGTHFFNPDGRQGTGGAEKHGPVATVRDLLFPADHSWPEVPVTPTRPPARVAGSAMRVTWIGHSTVLVQTQGLNILTDPVWAERASPVQFVGVRRVRAPGVRLEDLPRIDLVLISHDHYDHLDIATLQRLWRRDRPLVVAGLGMDRLLADHGVASQARDWGGRVAVRPGIDVVLTRAHHWSARMPGDRDERLWTGFVVTLPGGNLYFAGDTGPGDMRWPAEAARLGPVRLALLPIGAYHFHGPATGNHIGPDDAVRAFRMLGAHYALGVHWGTFELTSEGLNEPADRLAADLHAQGIAPARFRTTQAGEGWDVPLD